MKVLKFHEVVFVHSVSKNILNEMDKPTTSPERQGSVSPEILDNDVHPAVSGTPEISPNQPGYPARRITRKQSQSNESFDKDDPSSPAVSSSGDDEPTERSPVTRNRRRKLEIVDSDGYDKGSCFYRRWAVKAERDCNKQSRRYRWYHGMLHWWLILPWRTLWLPRV